MQVTSGWIVSFISRKASAPNIYIKTIFGLLCNTGVKTETDPGVDISFKRPIVAERAYLQRRVLIAIICTSII
jgi:hypothetical protein